MPKDGFGCNLGATWLLGRSEGMACKTIIRSGPRLQTFSFLALGVQNVRPIELDDPPCCAISVPRSDTDSKHPIFTAKKLFEKWKAAVFPGLESDLEFRGFRPYTATVYYVDKENRSCIITVDQMASEIRLAEEAAECAKNSK